MSLPGCEQPDNDPDPDPVEANPDSASEEELEPEPEPEEARSPGVVSATLASSSSLFVKVSTSSSIIFEGKEEKTCLCLHFCNKVILGLFAKRRCFSP